MIQILTVQNLNDKQKICSRAGLEYNDSLHIIASFAEDGQPKEAAVFDYCKESGRILWIESAEDSDLLEGIAKSLLSIMELRGVKTVTLPLQYADLAEKLRFTKRDDSYTVSLDGYFCCSCHNN